MHAAVLSIGSELLHGFLTDTNATFLTQELNALGLDVSGVFQVGDDLDRIVTAFLRALDDADLVIATGGIGPTEDDLTREAVAAICREEPRVDESLAAGIREYFAARGVPMPDQNVKQAWLIPSAEALDNPMGTAPGWYVHRGEKMIAIMPGVPREMHRMWREQVIPRVLDWLPGSAIVSRTLKTIGIGESAVEREIIDLVHRGTPTVATYAKDDGVHIRITAISDDREQAQRLVAETEAEIRERIGRYVYGYLDDALARAILEPVKGRGACLAIWEAGNAGRLANVLLEEDMTGEVVAAARTTSYDAAASRIGDDAPVSVARACAVRAAGDAGTSYAASVAVRISAGDTPDRARGEVGLALAHPGGAVTREHSVSAAPAEIRRRATMWACDFLWSTLRDTGGRPTE